MQANLDQDKNLADIVGKLKDHFHPTKVYLFGSRAKGVAREGSDYDLFLIVKNSEISSVERMKEAYRILWGRTVPVDVFVYTQEEFEEYKDEVNSIANTVALEGVEL